MQKLQLLVLLTLVLVICAKRDIPTKLYGLNRCSLPYFMRRTCAGHWFKDIPGVSEENMAKLREILKSGREEFRQKMEDWINSLPEEEKKAAETHREEIRKRHEARRAQKEKGDAEAESDD